MNGASACQSCVLGSTMRQDTVPSAPMIFSILTTLWSAPPSLSTNPASPKTSSSPSVVPPSRFGSYGFTVGVCVPTSLHTRTSTRSPR